MQYLNLKTLALLSVFVCASPAWSAQTCKTTITPTTPSSDFTAHGDGTVTHHKTGLMWKVCSESQTFAINNGAPTCTGKIATYNWQEAQAKHASFANHSDWRLPNLHELASITELSCYHPAINQSIFPSTSSEAYWSSSPYAGSHGYGAGIYFYTGYDSSLIQSSLYHVRLVRTLAAEL